MKLINLSLLLLFAISVCSCSNDDLEKYGQDLTLEGFNVDMRNNSFPPYIVGEELNLSFAAGSSSNGNLKDLQVKTNIAGASGTLLEKTGIYYNWNLGKDDTYTVFSEVKQNENDWLGTYVDTIAATAKFRYVIPNEAKGKKVEIIFNAGCAGGRATKTFDCQVSNIELKRNIPIVAANEDGSGRAFFSLSKMQAFSLSEVQSQNMYGEIDFVFVYDNVGPAASWKLNYAILAPSCEYMSSKLLGESWGRKNDTDIEIKNWEDYHLQGSGRMNFVDDLDFQKAQFVTDTKMCININNDTRALVKTENGEWIGLIWFKNVSKTNAFLNVKRYKVK